MVTKTVHDIVFAAILASPKHRDFSLRYCSRIYRVTTETFLALRLRQRATVCNKIKIINRKMFEPRDSLKEFKVLH